MKKFSPVGCCIDKHQKSWETIKIRFTGWSKRTLMFSISIVSTSSISSSNTKPPHGSQYVCERCLRTIDVSIVQQGHVQDPLMSGMDWLADRHGGLARPIYAQSDWGQGCVMASLRLQHLEREQGENVHEQKNNPIPWGYHRSWVFSPCCCSR